MQQAIDLTTFLVKLSPENGETIDAHCFDAAKEYVLNKLQHDHFPRYLLSECHCKYICNILERKELTLADVLYDDIAIVYLLEVTHINISKQTFQIMRDLLPKDLKHA